MPRLTRRPAAVFTGGRLYRGCVGRSKTSGEARLFAGSDLHSSVRDNGPLLDRIRPRTPHDWLIVAGDVAEHVDDIERTLRVLAGRFAKVIWAPGNHELWTHPGDPVQLRGTARYQRLVQVCRKAGVATPEDAYPVWHGPGGPLRIAPLFVLYDDSFLPDGATDSAPYPTREAWCAARVTESERRLAEADDPAVLLVLVNHFPWSRNRPRPCGTRACRCGAAWSARPTGTAASMWRRSSRGICTSPGSRGTTVSRTMRSPSAIRGSGAVTATPTACCVASPREPAVQEPAVTEPLLPSAAHRAAACADPAQTAPRPGQEASAGTAAPLRRRKHATVRHPARRALGGPGRPPVSTPRGTRGAPLWPRDVTAGLAGTVAATPCGRSRR